MVSNAIGMQLHNRAARGGTLTAKEQLLLAQWYELQDTAEAELVRVAQRETERLARENERTKQALEASNKTFAALQRDLDAWESKMAAWKASEPKFLNNSKNL